MEPKKWNSNPPDFYPQMIGKLFANLATLEFGLRTVLYLCETPTEKRDFPLAGHLTSLKPGEHVHESAITSWDTLGQLIAKYNRLNPHAIIPVDICDLRDALAHGRILSDRPDKDLTLVRFGRPRDGRVLVEAVHSLSVEWIGQQIHKIHDVAVVVQQRIRELSSN